MRSEAITGLWRKIDLCIQIACAQSARLLLAAREFSGSQPSRNPCSVPAHQRIGATGAPGSQALAAAEFGLAFVIASEAKQSSIGAIWIASSLRSSQ